PTPALPPHSPPSPPPPPPQTSTLSLHDALPISARAHRARAVERHHQRPAHRSGLQLPGPVLQVHIPAHRAHVQPRRLAMALELEDRKSTRLNSSHVSISYAVFCLKKKKKT